MTTIRFNTFLLYFHLKLIVFKCLFCCHKVSMQDPPCKTVRKFLHLLEHSDADFEEELGNSV